MKRSYKILLIVWVSISNCYTPEILIDHVQKSIENAIEEHSKLPEAVLALDGMSSAKVRHFLNNLCSLPGARYLEIGVFKGSTFISALYGNTQTIADAIAIDNWSQFKGKKEMFLNAVNNFLPPTAYRVLEADCFAIMVTDYSMSPITIYFYDGNHTVEAHKKAFTHHNDVLADIFIAVVDDWNWAYVRQGTEQAFKELDYTILFEQQLPARYNGDHQQWWNGLYVAVIQK